MLDAARATGDYYIAHAAAADGVPYWDTGAPGLAALGDWGSRPPTRSTTRARGQLRRRHRGAGPAPAWRASWPRAAKTASAYEQAGLRTLDTLFDPAGPT